ARADASAASAMSRFLTRWPLRHSVPLVVLVMLVLGVVANHYVLPGLHWLVMAAFALAAWLYVDRVVRARIDRVGAAARRIGHGALGVRAEVDGADEIAELAQAFNAAMRTIESDRAVVLESRQLLRVRNAELDALRHALDAHAIVSITDL